MLTEQWHGTVWTIQITPNPQQGSQSCLPCVCPATLGPPEVGYFRHAILITPCSDNPGLGLQQR
jgi:hypothetical protein